MNYWTRIKWGGIILFILTLAACSSSPAAIQQAPSLPETNPFEQADSNGGVRLGGYGAGFVGIDPLKGETLSYNGEPIQLSYFLQGTGSDTEVGLMLFMDGVVQPHRVIKTSQQQETPDASQEVLMSKHRVNSDSKIEFTVAFTPVIGSAGDEFGLNAIFLFEPSFVPENESQTFGVYQDGRFQIPLSIIMKTDAPQQARDYAVDVETTPIPQSEKRPDELNPSGRISQPHFLFYSGESYYPNKLIAEDGKIELTTSIYGGIEADYRVTVFVNHQPVSIAGHPNFLIRTHYDQISTYRFTLDVSDYGRINSLYAVILPTGQSYKDSDIYGRKMESILLINDIAETATPTAESTLPVRNTTAAIPLTEDTDLTHLLTENNLFPQYGESRIRLVDEEKLLVWFDSAALFDLSSERLLYKTKVTTGPSDQKVDFAENVEGVFIRDANCMDCPIRLDRYNLELNLFDSVDLSQIFDLRSEVLRPIHCALSQSGEKIICAKNETGQILFYNLKSKDKKVLFDFSKNSLLEFRGINSIVFAGNDSYLAFTAADSTGYGFGVIDLEKHQLADYTKWDAVADDIQVTENAIYFHEQLKSPTIPRSGKIFRIDLGTLEKQVIQFADEDESKYVTVSQTGKYIVTVRDTAEPGADYTSGSIMVYDGQTMDLIRQIDLERGFPRLVIDEAHRSLIACYSVDGNIKLIQYVF